MNLYVNCKYIISCTGDEIDGIKSGRVACFPDPQLGTIKWIGKINQIIWIGVEFVCKILISYKKLLYHDNKCTPSKNVISNFRIILLVSTQFQCHLNVQSNTVDLFHW